MKPRYYIRRDHLNGTGLMVTSYWDGRMFSSISAKGFIKASAALKCAGRLCKRAIAFGDELTICAKD